MADPLTYGAIAAAVIGAGATVYSSNQSAKAAKANRPTPPPKEAPQPDQVRLDAQKRRRQAGLGAADTKLTGPLGLDSTAYAGGPKTLLGQ